ncbi:abortive infection protein [Gottschalkia acidurici 9a]|uniref:Abortive infection protein n=1 Tax=Gottschalkia acidurici (strain ATCC 7906 / DSM 604 / BCRC 14475 / CIP 104303 / KCTC 5404 / NCIMB 10678 / 9a) TaxID=1128398 RepID=K0B0M7_GOTA9|nr:type II CAAX endopeptidase family protein [Gottschalkia acidurici]AFS78460.1 abortive infection protein [Gottschalkia acidurici 9a]
MRKKLKSLSSSNPLILSIYLMCIAMLFRLLDIFVLRLDDLLGEIILSKIIGFIIVILFVKMVDNSMSDIGFNINNKLSIFILGAVVTVVLMFIGYVGEFMIFSSDSPKLLISAIDPKAGVTGGVGFAIFLLFGNVINCFMEESLFRGVMIPLLNKKYSIKMTIFLQGLLFGIWHIPWAFKWYISGIVSGASGFIMALIINSIPMIFIGIVLGVMYYYTNSIWTPWISHFMMNSILNLVHVSINGKLNIGMIIRMSIFESIIFMLIPILIIITRKTNKVSIECSEVN